MNKRRCWKFRPKERRAYLVFGVADETHEILGTVIELKAKKVGNEIFEHWLLPAPLFREVEGSTVVAVFRPGSFAEMDKEARVRACYQHSCLRHESNDYMSNASFRIRLGLTEKQYPQVSLVIRDTIQEGLIRPLSEDQANRNARYVPWYA